MKIKNGFLLREIAGTNVIIPTGERVIDFKGMLMPNTTGSYIWQKLMSDITYEALLAAILDEYDIDETSAKTDLDDFLAEVRKCGALEE
jgi:hypothetical protein